MKVNPRRQWRSSSTDFPPRRRLDDVFVASTSVNDPTATDLQEINIEMLNESQHPASRSTGGARNILKPSAQSPADRDTPNTGGPMHIDLKKVGNVRDSGFLDDEDGMSSRGSELTTSRKTPSKPVKQYETVSEDAPTPNDLVSRKLKSK